MVSIPSNNYRCNYQSVGWSEDLFPFYNSDLYAIISQHFISKILTNRP